MEKEYKWDPVTAGLVLSSFYWGYIVMQFPAGWLATMIGGKSVMGIGTLGASIFSILLPIAATWNIKAIIASRILTGFFEGVSYPTIHILVASWFPDSERSRFIGYIWAGGFMGTIIGMVVSAPLIHHFGWQSVFYGMGGAGVLWSLLWFLLGGSNPEASWITGSAEKNFIMISRGKAEKPKKVPWLQMLTSVRLGVIVISHFCLMWTYTIALTWIPTYLHKELHFDISKAGYVGWIPYLASLVSSTFSGTLADYLIKKGYRRIWVRKGFQVTSLLFPAISFALLCIHSSAAVNIFLLVSAVGFCTTGVAGYAANFLDIGPKYAGIMFGIANIFGTVPGIVGVYVTGFILQKTASWYIVWVLAASINFVGFVAYMLGATGDLVFE